MLNEKCFVRKDALDWEKECGDLRNPEADTVSSVETADPTNSVSSAFPLDLHSESYPIRKFEYLRRRPRPVTILSCLLVPNPISGALPTNQQSKIGKN